MCRKCARGWLAGLGAIRLAALLVSASTGSAQTPAPEWRHIGGSLMEFGLPSPATGPVSRVWFSPDGQSLFARTASGRVFKTADLEQWQPVTDDIAMPPSESLPAVDTAPEANLTFRQVSSSGRIYGLGGYVYRSEDGGKTWSNLTGYKGTSILGSGLADLAVSPRDPDSIVVGGSTGVWHSVDGGLSWIGLNQTLPNLPVRRIYSTPVGTQGIRISLSTVGTPEVEWAPGEKSTWKPDGLPDVSRESALEEAISVALRVRVTAVGASGNSVYAGAATGQLWSSSDGGATWNPQADHPAIPVEAIYVDPRDPRIALATYSSSRSTRVVRTMNGGLFWDDITANLPDGAAHGITADRASGAIYVATDAGVFYTSTDLASAGRPTAWLKVSDSLPAAPATDVKLDAGANQLFAALDGYGVYATLAPHRLRDARVVNAADYSQRATAPGGLLSVLGTRILSAQSSGSPAPVLAASDTSSQIQVPFDATGAAVALALESAKGWTNVGFPLQNVSPAIFVDPDGSPLILDGASGILLDASKPAHAKAAIQILATGLGRVAPDWPAGLAAPANDPPRVTTSVHVFLDRTPLEVKQAILAPYIGYYLVEAVLPDIVNQGSAEIYIEAGGQTSNRVRITLEP